VSGLRVLVLHHQGWPPRGGDGVHVWAILRGLARLGLSVCTQGTAGPPEVRLVPPTRAGLMAGLREADVVYIRVDGGLNREKASFLARLPGRRAAVVWEVNASLEEQIPQGLPMEKLERWRRARRMLARSVDAAVIVSPELDTYVRRDLGISDVTVVENGAPWPWPSVAPSALRLAGDFRALWTGNAAYPWQAHDTVVAAARRLESRAPGVVVAAVGRAAPASGDAAGDPGNLLRLLPGDSAEAAAHLAASQCSLCLYHDTPWAPGGFAMSPIKLFEAWAAGVPVVASALGSLSRLVRDGATGLLVPDGDAAAVADAVVRLQSDAALRARLGEAGREEVARHFNWDRAAAEVAAVLERVARRPARTG
jgi:glycosyltransferase involved in cell wall biosynthesis